MDVCCVLTFTVEAQQFMRHAQSACMNIRLASTQVAQTECLRFCTICSSEAQEELHNLPEGFASFDKGFGQFAQTEPVMRSSLLHVTASFSCYGAAVCRTVVHCGVLAEA